MALQPNELFVKVDAGDTSKRVQADAIQPKTFAAVGAAETLPVLTPVARNSSTGNWAAWDANGANALDTCVGFVFPDPISLLTTGEVLGNVLMTGKVHYDDILAAVEERAVEVAADLVTELKSGPRALGLLVYGLPGVQ